MPTIEQQINQLKIDKQNLVSELNNMGVEASNNETFTSLTPKVGKIVTDPILQDKSIEITENGTTNITADEGYDGLNNVEVITNVAGSGGREEPTKGIVIKEIDEDGYPTKIKIVGWTSIPDYTFYQQDATYQTIFKKLTTVELPDTLTKIGRQAFQQCRALNIKTLPYITSILGNSFYSCAGLTQMSLPSIQTIRGSSAATSSTNGGSFMGCGYLKAVWLGSTLTSIGRYAFANSGVKKLFIDLPRVTVSAWSGADMGFTANTNNTDVLICNDDEGFMTQEEFDSIDWSTYTG